jgi:hypothetical protein
VFTPQVANGGAGASHQIDAILIASDASDALVRRFPTFIGRGDSAEIAGIEIERSFE